MLATVQDSMLTDGAKLAALPNVSAAPNDATKFLNGQGNWIVPPVSSVFGRTGAVTASTGDYTVSQVTNAVDTTGSYSNPSWITSLAGSKISGTVANATVSGSTTGNAATATSLATARAINGVNFDGTAPITVTAAAGTLTGTTLNATVVTSSLTTVVTIGTGVWQGTAIGDSYISSTLTGKSVNGVTLSTAAGATNFLAGDGSYKAVSGGSGTVTTVSVATANGVSGSVANATTTPAITLTLGAITPTTVNGVIINSNLGGIAIGNVNTGAFNVSIGQTAMTSNSGTSNTAVGYGALNTGTLGNNTAVGSLSMASMTTGASDTAVGSGALSANTSGSNNTAIGSGSLANNTTAGSNTAVGNSSINSNLTGQQNTAIGFSSLYNSTGDQNTAVGAYALYTTTGTNNVAIGYQAGRHETGSNTFSVDNQFRADTVTEKTNSILYGVMASAPTNQTLTVNALLTVTGAATVSSHFNKQITAGGVAIWKSDGTTPNGALSGTQGDICLNGPSGHMFWCGGTTTWTQI